MNPNVDAAVFETARGGILREGLGFDRCDVAVVTNIGEGDHLGLSEIHTVEALAKVKRCIVDVVPPDGTSVLNANDPHCVAMAPYSAGQNPLLRPGRQSSGDRAAPRRRRAGDLRPRQHDHRGRRRERRSVHVAWTACR